MNTLFKVYKYVYRQDVEKLFKQACGISMWFIVEIRRTILIYDAIRMKII